MLLLAAPLAFASPRTGPPPALIIFALGTGLLYVVADGVLTVMAQTQLAPSWVGAWSAFVIFALLAATVIVYEEA
jgi:lipopolysaccharide export LptBFGC system permease protein LptF